jgi:translation initiation factor IF-3
MRRRFRRPKKFKVIEPKFKANEKILSPQVFLIDENNVSLGAMDTAKAIDLSREHGYDLVEVSPKADPPVCRMIDFGKFQYQQAKQEQQAKSKQKKMDTKGVRIGLRTDTHDLTFKKIQSEKFLKKGHKVKIEIVLRGREKSHQVLAKQSLKEFLASIEVPHTIEDEIKSFPGGFNTLIAPE